MIVPSPNAAPFLHAYSPARAPSPRSPHDVAAAPHLPHQNWSRKLSQSATTTSPEGRNATPCGRSNRPRRLPALSSPNPEAGLKCQALCTARSHILDMAAVWAYVPTPLWSAHERTICARSLMSSANAKEPLVFVPRRVCTICRSHGLHLPAMVGSVLTFSFLGKRLLPLLGTWLV